MKNNEVFMSVDKNIKNIKIVTTNKTYFIDVNQKYNGQKYLSISENRQVNNTDYPKYGVQIFEEDINTIIEEIRFAFQNVESNEKPKCKMYETKKRYANAYTPWIEEEDTLLKNLFNQGKKIREISNALQRNPGAINSRIRKLGLN